MKVARQDVNIWDDPSAAAFVRSVTGGDETVPTVVIGTTTMVNPSPRAVRRELESILRSRRQNDTGEFDAD